MLAPSFRFCWLGYSSVNNPGRSKRTDASPWKRVQDLVGKGAKLHPVEPVSIQTDSGERNSAMSEPPLPAIPMEARANRFQQPLTGCRFSNMKKMNDKSP